MSPTWTCRPATPDDYAVQAALFNSCFRKQKGADTFRWKYSANPHGAAISRLALDGTGRVVGGYSYVPRRFLRDGRMVTLMQASDAMVAPEARRQGIFTGLDDLVCAEAGRQGVSLAYAYSGRLSYTGFLGNGWRAIGHAWVLRYAFRSARGLGRAGRLAPLLVPFAPLVDRGLRRRDRRLGGRGPDLAALTRVQRFDEAFDEFLDASAPAQGLFGLRDPAWLNWRYIDTPERRQECWALRSPDGRRVLAWMALEFVDGNAYLVDHQARDEVQRRAILSAFTVMAHARGMQEATALLFDHHPSVPVLLGLGWRRPRRDKEFRDRFPWIVRVCGDESRASPDLVMERWWLADGDRDAEHISP